MAALTQRLLRNRSELGWVVLGQLLAFGGGLLGVKLLTRLLGPAGYGSLALGLTVAGSLNLLLYGPIGQAVMRFYAVYRERGDTAGYQRMLRNLHLWVAMALILVGCIATVVTGIRYGPTWASLIGLATLAGILGGINTTAASYRLATRARKEVVWHQGGDAILRPLLAAAIVLWISRSAPAALAGFVVATTVILVSRWMRSLWSPVPSDPGAERGTASVTSTFGRADLGAFLRFGSAFSLFAIPAMVSAYSDRWVLQGLFGPESVGVYVALVQIGAAPILLLEGVISQFILPTVYQQAGAMRYAEHDTASYRTLRQGIIAFALLALPAIGAAYLFGKPLVTALSTSGIADHAGILWIVVGGATLFSIGQLLHTRAACHHRPLATFPAKLLHGVLFCLLAVVMGRQSGLPGVAWAMALASAAYAAAMALMTSRLASRFRRSAERSPGAPTAP